MTSNRIQATRRKASKPANVTTQARVAMAEDNRADIYHRITDRIAAAIEAGAGKWQMPWHPGTDGAAQCLPVNAATGKPYRGINTVVLWATAQAEGYPGAVWATYHQWQELGAQVRKGEQSSPVVFWKINGSDGGEDGDSTGGGNAGGSRVRLPRFRGRFVGLRTTAWQWRPACRLRRSWESGSPGPSAAAPGCTNPRCS